ncbi:hypothetical protein [uncultured Desulfosarcina sp.]|uniref:hypothetical protein n=1 Tax=uncultured Desulfosarcina sp. TaxID=218289 RepID=UPI0029C7E027|nr:hypothetical protein [uncultured Desulfosarcina sp.]
MKKLVSENALVKRIKRKLEEQGLLIKKNPKGPYMENMGEYLITNNQGNLVQTVDDIEAFAREEGVLKDSEKLGE